MVRIKIKELTKDIENSILRSTLGGGVPNES